MAIPSLSLQKVCKTWLLRTSGRRDPFGQISDLAKTRACNLGRGLLNASAPSDATCCLHYFRMRQVASTVWMAAARHHIGSSLFNMHKRPQPEMV